VELQLDLHGARPAGQPQVRLRPLLADQINGDGSFQAQGYTPGVYGNDPFQSQGQWKVEQGFFMANAPEYGPNVLPGMKFMMGGEIKNGELSSRYDMKDPSGTWIMNRSLMACQRA
jgi:hypothetical protein